MHSMPAEVVHHRCHFPGCNLPVPPARWGCRSHWFMLPVKVRRRIWETYRPGQEQDKRPSREYVLAVQDARDWIHANLPAEVKRLRELWQAPEQSSLGL